MYENAISVRYIDKDVRRDADYMRYTHVIGMFGPRSWDPKNTIPQVLFKELSSEQTGKQYHLGEIQKILAWKKSH